MRLITICQISISLLISINLCAETITFSETEIEEKIKTKGSRNNFLGPSARIQLSHDFYAFVLSGLFEGGPKQLRSNATFGFCLGSNEKTGIKISGEHLMQDLKFNFYTGSQKKWVHQASGGIGIKHVFEKEMSSLFVKSCQLDGYYSHSWSRKLSKNPLDPYKISVNHRRIAGANAWGGKGGADLQFKKFRTVVGLDVSYDHVKYDIKNGCHLSKSGIGGGISLLHPFSDTFDLRTKASFRKPFNNYSGELNWKPKSFPGLTAGFFGGYTAGKYCLASSYDIGIRLSYVFKSKKTEPSHETNSGLSCLAPKNYLKTWLQEPVVKMAQVLAISDEKLTFKEIIKEVKEIIEEVKEDESDKGVINGTIPDWDINSRKFMFADITAVTDLGQVTMTINGVTEILEENKKAGDITPSRDLSLIFSPDLLTPGTPWTAKSSLGGDMQINLSAGIY
ncbi:hypothetical protein [Candidatus Neptunichlamydia sp. REUL1]|uniref:hypothetical protein n=1 Tax=Candidatus Neptunichlamydia sp. REUL1 TaxID=3064277 RepID=UPI002930A68E|nr:hypothetical protein [Candidatus Neptunochlamydia sp. REUL1]